jgi:hypothetical protein
MTEASNPPLPTGYVIATKLVAEKRRPVRFMYREEPNNEHDSGWRVFAGEEDQAYTDNPDNLALYAASTIVAIDPSISSLLMTPAPCAFERDSAREPFRPSADYDFSPEE